MLSQPDFLASNMALPDAAPVSPVGLSNVQPASLLLVVSAQSTNLTDGNWQFVIETADGEPILEANDTEHGDLNRLTLLAAVRGLEAVDGPSQVTLLSHNRYLIRSLTDSLPRWRRSDFVWDHFGRRVEVQHADLWRRIDHALGIHQVQACLVTSRLVSRPAQASTNPLQASDPTEQPSTHSNASGAIPSQQESDRWIRTDSAHTDAPNPPIRSRSKKSSRNHQTGDRLRDWLLDSAISRSGSQRSSSAPPALESTIPS